MKRMGEWKEKILMTIHIFSVPQNFFNPHKTKIHHFSNNYIFYQQRLSNFLYTKVEKFLVGKGWIWHVSVNFNQGSIKALQLPPYHSAIPQSKEHRFNPSSILIMINMTHIFVFKFRSIIIIFIVEVKQMNWNLSLIFYVSCVHYQNSLIIVVKLIWRNMTKGATK